MLLGKTVNEILSLIGHDGSEVWFPKNPHPRCCRGFTTQELIDVADYFGYPLMEIEAVPAIWDGKDLDSTRDADGFPFGRDVDTRIHYYMGKYKGMIIGCYAADRLHAAAWDGKYIYDPSPRVYEYETTRDRIIVERFLALIESNHPSG